MGRFGLDFPIRHGKEVRASRRSPRTAMLHEADPDKTKHVGDWPGFDAFFLRCNEGRESNIQRTFPVYLPSQTDSPRLVKRRQILLAKPAVPF